MSEEGSICDLRQSLTLNSMELPDTIPVFYYAQPTLVLAINIPALAVAFSQGQETNKKPNNYQKHQRAWKMFWEAEEW